MNYLLQSILLDSAIFSFVALGVMILFIWGKLADLTPDASFVTGAIAAWLAVAYTGSFALAILLAIVSGCAAGSVTFGITRLRVPVLLSSLITTGIAYSIHWNLMGKPLRTMSSGSLPVLSENELYLTITSLFIVTAISFLIYLGVRSRLGLRFIAMAQNENSAPIARTGNVFASWVFLATGNACVGVGGALFFLRTGIAEINMGLGVTIGGLASFMIGWALLNFSRHAFLMVVSAIVGALLMRGILSFALTLGVSAEWFRLITALGLLVVLAMVGRSAKDVFKDIRL